MFRFLKKEPQREDLVLDLTDAIIAEQALGVFYRYIADAIDNPEAKKHFIKFYHESKRHKGLLQKRLKMITAYRFNPDLSKFDIDIESVRFSPRDSLLLVKEAEERSVDFYKRTRDKDKWRYRRIYDQIIKDEEGHRNYLGKEKIIVSGSEYHSDPKVIKMLCFVRDAWK